ncbi:MAG: NAD(P)-dependent oxidoreductase [Hydrotalea sp.]|nr:NAD(P)-dependent oxidoreductase [Hydrotalea sp.]
MSQDKLLKFTTRPQAVPEKRPAAERATDFQEIVKTYLTDRAENQSGRCAQCGVPFCQIHCPLSNNIPDWLYLTAQGRLEEAYHLSTATNYFPEVCGRVCPQDRLCEGGCVIEQAGHGYVTIGAVEKYITEHAFEMDWVKPITPASERPEKIAIIGAGPTGLSAGIFLRRQGYQIHVFDRYDRAGGLLIYGIPNFKLEKSVVLRRQELLEKSGFHFYFGVDVASDFKDIEKNHAAVVIATGVYKNKELDIATNEAGALHGVVPALPFLTRENKLELKEKDISPALSAKDKVVAVIGGGDTAMDCVRTAVRQGAKKVYCLYRRDRANMPGSVREVKNAEEEGVEFLWLTAPLAFHKDETSQQLASIDYCTMALSDRGADGRQTVAPVAGSEKNMKVDLAILALGFDAENCQTMFDAPGLALSSRGTLLADAAGRVLDKDGAAIEKIYAGGDIVRGASLVVWAIKDGMTVGQTIHQDIQKSSSKNKKQRAA